MIIAWLLLMTAAPCEHEVEHGCAYQFLSTEELTKLRRGATQDDAFAVTRLSQERFTIITSRNKQKTIVERRTVREILREGGRWANAVRVALPKEAEFIALQARSLTTDNRMAEVSEAEILKAEGENGKSESQLRVFRIPRVEVGSLIEFVMVYELPWPMLSYGGVIGDYQAVDRYEFEMFIDNNARFDLMGQRYPGTFALDKQSRFQHVTSVIENVPGYDDETWSASIESLAPTWLFRVLDMRGPGWFWASQDTWAHVLSYDALKTYGLNGREDNVFANVDTSFPHANCLPDAAACLASAWNEVRKYPLKAAYDSDVRKLKDAIAENAFTPGERTALLTRYMRDLGFRVDLVFAAGQRSSLFDETYPMGWPMIAMMPKVHLPTGPVVIDTGCDACAVNVVRPVFADTKAVVVATNGSENRDGLTATMEMLPSRGEVAHIVKTNYQVALGVDANDAEVAMVRTYSGLAATHVAIERRDWDKDDHRRHLDHLVHTLVGWKHPPTTRSDRCAGTTCTDEVAGRGSIGDASFVEGKVTDRVVPLEVSSTFPDHTSLLPEHGPRRAELVIIDPQVIIEEVRLVPPEGYATHRMPTPKTTQHLGMTISLRAEQAKDGSVVVTREWRTEPGRYPATKAAEMEELLARFAALRNEVVVFRAVDEQQPSKPSKPEKRKTK
jgi:hypothetical protein